MTTTSRYFQRPLSVRIFKAASSEMTKALRNYEKYKSHVFGRTTKESLEKEMSKARKTFADALQCDFNETMRSSGKQYTYMLTGDDDNEYMGLRELSKSGSLSAEDKVRLEYLDAIAYKWI